MGWGISPNASKKEKIKSELNDYLNGLNCTGNIDYSTYSELYDYAMEKLEEMYELGIEESKGGKSNAKS